MVTFTDFEMISDFWGGCESTTKNSHLPEALRGFASCPLCPWEQEEPNQVTCSQVSCFLGLIPSRAIPDHLHYTHPRKHPSSRHQRSNSVRSIHSSLLIHYGFFFKAWHLPSLFRLWGERRSPRRWRHTGAETGFCSCCRRGCADLVLQFLLCPSQFRSAVASHTNQSRADPTLRGKRHHWGAELAPSGLDRPQQVFRPVGV